MTLQSQAWDVFKKTQVYLLGHVCNPAIGFPVAILEFKQHFNYIILPSLANFDFVKCLIISLCYCIDVNCVSPPYLSGVYYKNRRIRESSNLCDTPPVQPPPDPPDPPDPPNPTLLTLPTRPSRPSLTLSSCYKASPSYVTSALVCLNFVRKNITVMNEFQSTCYFPLATNESSFKGRHTWTLSKWSVEKVL